MSLLTRILAKRGLVDAQSETVEFLAGGGAMGAHMRGLDWSKSPLGHPIPCRLQYLPLAFGQALNPVRGNLVEG